MGFLGIQCRFNIPVIRVNNSCITNQKENIYNYFVSFEIFAPKRLLISRFFQYFPCLFIIDRVLGINNTLKYVSWEQTTKLLACGHCHLKTLWCKFTAALTELNWLVCGDWSNFKHLVLRLNRWHTLISLWVTILIKNQSRECQTDLREVSVAVLSYCIFLRFFYFKVLNKKYFHAKWTGIVSIYHLDLHVNTLKFTGKG